MFYLHLSCIVVIRFQICIFDILNTAKMLDESDELQL